MVDFALTKLMLSQIIDGGCFSGMVELEARSNSTRVHAMGVTLYQRDCPLPTVQSGRITNMELLLNRTPVKSSLFFSGMLQLGLSLETSVTPDSVVVEKDTVSDVSSDISTTNLMLVLSQCLMCLLGCYHYQSDARAVSVSDVSSLMLPLPI
ncbi:hypothetical protein RRG08_013855 [Elysia crispata]|uniref:Uncharacterized protein n=1 Tax=Elysia crispata TaxID=231223 RepID=A0AAE0ZS41_9GAST|nr:hypothetical protein RRG08_013855 [Elysia crispata]